MWPLFSTFILFTAVATVNFNASLPLVLPSSNTSSSTPSPTYRNYNPFYLFNSSRNLFILTNDKSVSPPPPKPSSYKHLTIKKKRNPPFSNSSTELCDSECLLNWQICYERFCCPSSFLPHMYDGSFFHGYGKEKIHDVMDQIRKTDKCFRKEVGKEDCPDGMAIVCYWFDHVGVDTWCLTVKETGGERTNFYFGGDEEFDDYRYYAYEANKDHISAAATSNERLRPPKL